jgi:hypothetical protein
MRCHEVPTAAGALSALRASTPPPCARRNTQLMKPGPDARNTQPHTGPTNAPGTHYLVATGPSPIAAVPCNTRHSQYACPIHKMLLPCQLYPQTTGIYKLQQRHGWPTQQQSMAPNHHRLQSPHPHPMPKAPTNQSPNSPNPPQRRQGLRETCQHSCRSNSQQHAQSTHQSITKLAKPPTKAPGAW